MEGIRIKINPYGVKIRVLEAMASTSPVATTAAAVLHGLEAGALDHCIAGPISAEPGHGHVLAALGKEPLVSLGMRLGEGSGAALALGIVRGAVAAHAGMATFAEAGVSDKD